jgi:DNA mismatch endonuclease (patch repair protein)
MDVLTPEERRRNMAAIRGKDTQPEMLLRRLVHSMGYRYRLHVRNLPGCPDIVLPRHRKVILVHGCFWHRHNCRLGRPWPRTRAAFWRVKLDANKARDSRNLQKLRQLGWKVLTVWECQLHHSKMDKVSARITRFLAGS